MKTLGNEIKESAEKVPRTYALIGAAMEVHRQLGCEFLEGVYQEALAIELTAEEVPYRREVELPIFYKRQRLNTSYRADFICYDSVIVEIKALSKLGKVEEAQIINYLKATGCRVGVLLNFGSSSLEYRRFAFNKSAQSA
ncbi:MAG: GxxExxY protein [Betaproteobacteria bacterium]